MLLTQTKTIQLVFRCYSLRHPTTNKTHCLTRKIKHIIKLCTQILMMGVDIWLAVPSVSILMRYIFSSQLFFSFLGGYIKVLGMGYGGGCYQSQSDS